MENFSWGNLVLVALGSAVGGAARWCLGLWLNSRFPWGTLVANISGCLLLGLLLAILTPRENHWRLLLGVGFLGGYTTFSTLMVDTVRLGARAGSSNLLLSVVLGALAVWVGGRLGAAIAAR
jgi:fluoride exporter